MKIKKKVHRVKRHLPDQTTFKCMKKFTQKKMRCQTRFPSQSITFSWKKLLSTADILRTIDFGKCQRQTSEFYNFQRGNGIKCSLLFQHASFLHKKVYDRHFTSKLSNYRTEFTLRQVSEYFYVSLGMEMSMEYHKMSFMLSKRQPL